MGTDMIEPVETAAAVPGAARRRVLPIAISAVVAAGALIGGTFVLNGNHMPTPTQGGAVAAGAHVVPTTAPATTSKAVATTAGIPQPTGPKSTTTPAAIIYRLQQLLPAGQTSGFGKSVDGAIFGQIYLNQGHGPAMLRMEITQQKSDYVDPDPVDPCKSGKGYTTTCTTFNGAQVVITRIPDNCIQSLVVDVDHGDGVDVQLNVSTCLAWDGHENKPTGSALNVDQAVKIAADPSWGVRMDSGLVAAAAQKFPHLATFS